MKGLLLSILLIITLCTNAYGQISVIDITANWHDENGFLPKLQTHEPELKDNECKNFTQDLKLPAGNYKISFEYEPGYEKITGQAIKKQFNNFEGLKIDGKTYRLSFSPQPAKNGSYLASTTFNVINPAKTTLSLAISNTRVIRTWLTGNDFKPASKNFFAVNPNPANEFLIVRQIPFLTRKTDELQYGVGFYGKHPTEKVDRGILTAHNGTMTFNLGGTRIKKLHFLGMIHQIDIGMGAWSSKKGDHGYNHFVGDKAGDIIINCNNNKKITVPLIFGFNIWYGRPWDMFWFHFPGGASDNSARLNFDKELFSGDPAPRTAIENALYLTDGTRLMGSRSSNTRYIFSLDIGNLPVKSIEIKGTKEMYGVPLISAITIEAATASPILTRLPDICTDAAVTKTITIKDINSKSYLPAVEKLKHALYTFKEDLPKLKEAEIPKGYFGPQYNFKGTQEAIYAATYMYRNGPECGAKIADNGTTCSSSLARFQTARYTLGTGIWRGYQPLFGNIQQWFELYKNRSPGQLPGAGQAWSRGIGELMREAMAAGYGKFVNTYTNWVDSTLYTDAYPAHWNRVPGMGAGGPGFQTRKVGSIIERGNRENDGHGICMMGRYLVYHWQGHPLEWNKQHWAATKAAVDWIQWQLDTDTIFPKKRIDLLYTESESGNYEFYSSYNCLHGIKLSIIMAKELGKTAEVAQWTKLYNRLQKGILENATTPSEFGPIWFTNSENWHDGSQKLANIQLATDGITYTPLEYYANGTDMEKKYLEIDRNTYRYLLKDKNYNCLRMYGYGQGMMAQSALLMDEMDDAEKFINVMVDHSYLPKMEGWAAPEGIMLHKSGKYWMPVCGYLGQDSHLADSEKALRLMLGIDDNDPYTLNLVPRYPATWNKLSISDYPVLTDNKRQNLAYTYSRNLAGQRFDYKFDFAVKKMNLRLGPIPTDKTISKILVNETATPFRVFKSGDSKWVWIKNLNGKEGNVQIEF